MCVERAYSAFMKIARLLLTFVLATGFCEVAGRAAEAPPSPAGRWQWTAIGRTGAHDFTGDFAVQGEKLTGAITTPRGVLPVQNGVFKDGAVAFQTETTIDGEKSTSRYSGKLAGDKITGTIERSARGGGPGIRVDWNAVRVK
jgi:hypothetical protein